MIERVDTVVVLAGGRGTRLHTITGDRVAKPAVLVNNRPFLAYVIDELRAQGLRRIILSLGHKAESVVARLEVCGVLRDDVECHIEKEPLGTAGPLRQLQRNLPRSFFVVNGDTFVSGLKLAEMAAFHVDNRGDVTLAVCLVEDSVDYGMVELSDDGRLVGFREKKCLGPSYVNSGVYVIEKDVLKYIPQTGSYSMEQQLITDLIARRCRVFGYKFQGCFFDIGTPSRLAQFETFLKRSIAAPREG